MRKVVPDCYRIERIGTQDPEDSGYVVLDLTTDMRAREVMWLLIRRYRNDGPSIRADELEQMLRDTENAYAASVRRRVERVTALSRSKPSRSRRATPS